MQQASLSIPTEKINLSKEYLGSLASEEKMKVNLSMPSYRTNSTESPNTFFKNSFSWEYYSNELEFE